MEGLGGDGQDPSSTLPHIVDMLVAFDLAGKQKFNGKRINEPFTDTTILLRKRARMQIKPTSDSDKRLAVLQAKATVALLDVYNECYTLQPSPATPCPAVTARASMSSTDVFAPGTPFPYPAPNSAPPSSPSAGDSLAITPYVPAPPSFLALGFHSRALGRPSLL